MLIGNIVKSLENAVNWPTGWEVLGTSACFCVAWRFGVWRAVGLVSCSPRDYSQRAEAGGLIGLE